MIFAQAVLAASFHVICAQGRKNDRHRFTVLLFYRLPDQPADGKTVKTFTVLPLYRFTVRPNKKAPLNPRHAR